VQETASLTRLFALPEDQIDLGRAALLLACLEYPDLNVDAELRRLDELARQAAPFVPPDFPAEARLKGLETFLGGVCGFRGNQDDYYDPSNSFLNRVLDRRTGIPISLSVVYLETARRLGLRLFGVGLPGHFLVKYQDRENRVFLDPFHGGRVLTADGCREIVEGMYRGEVAFREDMLAAVDKRYIILRMLHNLRGIYLEQRQLRKALPVVGMILELQPDSAEDRKLRGLLNYQAGRHREGRQDLEDYLRLQPQAPDADQIREVIAEIRRRSILLN
jgi:regulator of sirC expression with transglutaminase-like and TPR domain